MTSAADESPDVGPSDGKRAVKRRETLKRIAKVGLRLFIEKGFDATTLDEIAEAAGISRRTFFYYFESKEDVLLAHEGGDFAKALRPAMLRQSPGQPPLMAVRKCILELAPQYEGPDAIAADRLLRSTEALRLRKAALFVEMEKALADAMAELWPDLEKTGVLRTAAMVAMGAVRLALDDWRAGEGGSSLATCINLSFDRLDLGMCD
ncbi:TetR/AcrR family transcriptional regulator [Stakelama sp. CBK3Z-3]|uniref:TetR/AcrR family transcriptional regulator n=1 Tax=Stakelama flava TaxID=2860338 RepID=A0ABS6XIM4_9SPHN|nr:TetR family transcriptional regulator [Stakelama flava]MBW4330035.1 TetR/AcrR family transcriptional regulator [Stakelama flava]